MGWLRQIFFSFLVLFAADDVRSEKTKIFFGETFKHYQDMIYYREKGHVGGFWVQVFVEDLGRRRHYQDIMMYNSFLPSGEAAEIGCIAVLIEVAEKVAQRWGLSLEKMKVSGRNIRFEEDGCLAEATWIMP